MKAGNFIGLIDKIKKKSGLDLSLGQDLSIGIMNLISLEEHFEFSFMKTHDQGYLGMLEQTRELRKRLLKKIVKENHAEDWCLPPQTVIYGDIPKNIEDFRLGEKVLTRTGKLSGVNKVLIREYKGDLISILPYYAGKLLITPEHPVLCVTGVRNKQEKAWRKSLEKPRPVWKNAKDLVVTDFLVFPRYGTVKDMDELDLLYEWINPGCYGPAKRFSREMKVRVDEKLLELIGLYIAEGSVSEGNYSYKGTRKKRSTAYFSFGKHETELIKRAQELFESVFRFAPGLSETHTTFDLTCNKRVVTNFFKQFGKGSKNKILPQWVIDLPNDKLFPLLNGLIEGDGCEDDFCIDYFTSSRTLAFQLRLMLFKMGLLHSLKKVEVGESKIGNRAIKASSIYAIKIAGDSARLLSKKTGLQYNSKQTSGNFGYIFDDYVMLPIREISKENYIGKVYNLEVENEQSYTTFTGVVHNCISKHLLAATMRLTEVGTKYLHDGKRKEAEEMFLEAFNLYSLFWSVNGAGGGNLKAPSSSKLEKSRLSAVAEAFRKLIDCCKE